MKPTYSGVPYGRHERQALDFYQAQSDQPTPVLIYFHGGGFVNGDKANLAGRLELLLGECLPAGVSVVSANYRFIREHPFPAPMNDGTRAIQYVKSKAREWNIDPDRVAVSGGSAGANIGLWNAVKGDRSNPGSEDPLERIPSTVTAVVAFDGQITKDPRFYKEIYLGPKQQNNILFFFGADSVEELESPRVRALAEESHTIGMIGPGTPPVMMDYARKMTEVPMPADMEMGYVIHHPVYGQILKEKMDGLGLQCVFHHPDDPRKPGEIIQFLQAAWHSR